MVELINTMTGTRMLVAEDREAEYLAAGHRPAREKKEAAPTGGGNSADLPKTTATEEKKPAAKTAAGTAAKSTGAAAKKTSAAPKRKTAAKK